MPRKETQEHLIIFLCPSVKANNWLTLGETYCQSSRRLSVSDTSLPCGLVVHINLVIACFVQASDDRLLKMRINHHNQQPRRLINRLFPIISTSLLYGITDFDDVYSLPLRARQVLGGSGRKTTNPKCFTKLVISVTP